MILITRSPPHSVWLHLVRGQTITILSRPFWCWFDEATLAGTYVVAATTFHQATADPTSVQTTTDVASAALLGIVPLHAFIV